MFNSQTIPKSHSEPKGLSHKLQDSNPDWILQDGFSPQRGVVKLDPEQVSHPSLSWVVDDELVVEQRVTIGVTNACFNSRTHRDRHSIPEGQTNGGKK